MLWCIQFLIWREISSIHLSTQREVPVYWSISLACRRTKASNNDIWHTPLAIAGYLDALPTIVTIPRYIPLPINGSHLKMMIYQIISTLHQCFDMLLPTFLLMFPTHINVLVTHGRFSFVLDKPTKLLDKKPPKKLLQRKYDEINNLNCN